MKKLRIGIVGCGGIAGAHRGAYQAVGGNEIVSLFDVRPEAAAAFGKELPAARVATSIADMIAHDRLDAVSVCSPPAVHLANCAPFLKAGIGVLCEKPLELGPTTAAKLAALVKKTRSVFMTAYCHRFHPAVIELKSLIRRGVLGKPVLFRNIFSGMFNLKGNHRANPKLSGGGVIMDNASHSSDLYRFLVGDPTHVEAFGGNVVQKSAVEDFGMLHLDCGGRAYGDLVVTYSVAVGTNWVEWYGTKGTALISYWNEGRPDLTYKTADGPWTTVDCSKHPSRFVGEMTNFLASIRSHKTPAITVEDGLKANRIVAAAYESIRTGKRIKVKM